MSKKLIRIYVSYGKGNGNEISNQYVFEDTKSARLEIYEDEMGHCDDIYDSVEYFLNGVSDSLAGGLYGGDWDGPTGKEIVIYGKDELIEKINVERDAEVERIERLFEGRR